MTRAAAALLGAVLIQASPGPQRGATFRSETRLVVLHATVKDGRGVEISDLDRQAFRVYEDGKRQAIELFRRDDIPVSIGLLLDNSGSMLALRERVEAAALAFVRASNPLDEAFVLNFADKPRIDVPLTTDIRTLEGGIGRVDSIGGTALRDAIASAQDYLALHATHERRVLLVITDGRDNASITSVRDVQRAADRADMAVYAVGLFNDPDSANARAGRRELDDLTSHTGGLGYYPASVDETAGVVRDLARQIRDQYTIAYAPTNQALDGTYRRIRVEARGRTALVVHTRAGYVASPAAGTTRP